MGDMRIHERRLSEINVDWRISSRGKGVSFLARHFDKHNRRWTNVNIRQKRGETLDDVLSRGLDLVDERRKNGPPPKRKSSVGEVARRQRREFIRVAVSDVVM